MTPLRLAAALMSACLALTPVITAAQDKPIRGDVRTFRVGMTVDQLPREGYLGFACGQNGDKPSPEISGWDAYAECVPEDDGLHEVAFQYDDSENRYESLEGTAVAGHPVIISLLISAAGVVDGIRVFTDPFARPYHIRRARTMSRKVKARFGMDGWDCHDVPRADTEVEVGGVFTKERCKKSLDGRTVDLYTQFYRTYATGEEQIINSVWFEVRKSSTS